MKESLISGGLSFGATALLAVVLGGGIVAAGCQDSELAPVGDFTGDAIYLGPPPESVTHAIASGPIIAYLNFRGGTLNAGFDNSATNTSAILGGTSFPAFSPTGFGCGTLEQCEDILVGMSQDLWSQWNVIFTDERPSSGDYEMVMIGGSSGGSTLGVALLDCGDQWPSNISFAFSQGVAGGGCPLEALTAIIAQELAHALGLCHNGNQNSLMFPGLWMCAGNWGCGAQVDECGCIGAGYDPFCAPPYLDDLLGPPTDDVPPTVEFIAPIDGSLVDQSFEVAVEATDDRGDPQVFLYIDGVLVGGSLSAPPYTWMIADQSFGLHFLEAWAWDAFGNMSSALISVEIVSPDDLGDIGDACESDTDCGGTTFCAFQGADGYCTDYCDTADDCPDEFSCTPAGASNVCWPPAGYDPDGCGCRVAGRQGPDGIFASAALLLAPLLAGLLLHRRGRSSGRGRRWS